MIAALGGPVISSDRASADAAFNQRMLELINRDRVASGVAPVAANAVLAAIAEDAPYAGCGFPVAGRAADMGRRNYFSHTILNCGTQGVFQLLAATGLPYSGAAENIAWVNGVTDPLVAAENLHNQLMNSAAHRSNVLNAKWTHVGVGSWRTAPAQTWSGGGFPLPNVYIVTEIFAALPKPAGDAATTTTGPPSTGGPPGRFTPLSPARILDTRTGTGGLGPVGPGATAELQVTGRGGIPAMGVAAVAMNVTVTSPTGDGYMTLFPSGTPRPLAANLNFVPGETVANLVVVKVGSSGKVSLFNSAGTSHAIADVAGWYSDAGVGNAGRFEPLAPARILDTRPGAGGRGPVGPGGSVDLQVTGRGGVPAAGVSAVALNVTVTGTSHAGYLTAHPSGEGRPNASNLNFPSGATVANRVFVKVGAGGKVTLYNATGTTDVIVDVSGWYSDVSVAGSLGAFVPLEPARILDTRAGLGGLLGLMAQGGTTTVQVTGRGGVPASGARAVVMNATATGSTAPGYLSVFPTGVAQPLASDLNFSAGDTQPNLVVVQLGGGGTVSVFTSAPTHFIFDVAGWIS